MLDSVVGGGIITGIIVVAAVIIDALGIIDGAIDVIVGTFAAVAAAATDFERTNFGAWHSENSSSSSSLVVVLNEI